MAKFSYKRIQKYIPRWLEITFGVFLVLLGIAGLVLPFLQGFLFIFLGIMLISPYHGKKIANRFKKYYKNTKEKVIEKKAEHNRKKQK
jgi:uncharacterized membrane protein YbaN (DUF454 family)